MKIVKRDSDKKTKFYNRGDPYLDRRSGEDRRAVHSLEYFQKGYFCRRSGLERRNNYERRAGCIRVSEWSSVCLVPEDKDSDDEYLIMKS